MVTENTKIPQALTEVEANTLFPIFLKLEKLRVLIVGGGNVGLEKLNAVLTNSPATRINLVATGISADIKAIAAGNPSLQLLEKPYEPADLEGMDIVITAINDPETSRAIVADANAKGILINAADKPDLCDFYLSSVVKKGNLKIAISTNGKSPTVAKRLKETFADMLPDELDEVLDNMVAIRKKLNGNFADKVSQLNDITKLLASKQMDLDEMEKPVEKKWQKIVKWCLFAFCFMIIGHGILSYIPMQPVIDSIKTIPRYIDPNTFLLMLLCGFLAQMVDGSLGMGYGTISTTFLLAMGVNPAIVSSRVHSARVFSSGVSGYSHHRFGNINRKLFKALVIPGLIGAIIGAVLAFVGQKYSSWVRLPLSVYTFYLGYYIIRKAYKKTQVNSKVKKAGWLAAVGGFMDAFAGGGWGTLVTSTLISKRKSPRYVIGSVCLAEFFVVLSSSLTFFILLQSIPLLDVLGLIVGGLIAAPIAARLVGKLPTRTMYIAVGVIVIATSTFTLWKVINNLLHVAALAGH
ncbi:MAG: TSUP family transporter [Chitinophagaceae bacterium]